MESIAYYDGNIGSPDELMVPFNDRSHFFGDGVYDATMGTNGRVFLVEEHLDRFFTSAAMFDINIPLSKDELKELLTDLLVRIESENPSTSESAPSGAAPSADASTPAIPCAYFVYWQVTRASSGVRSHVFDADLPGKLWAVIAPEELADPKRPLKLITLEDHRYEYCNAKTLNLLPAVMYANGAHRAGADEAVLHRDGIVTECAHSNALILKNGALISHPDDQHILRGVAKTHLIQAAQKAAVPIIERAFTLDELRDADEVIVTSSGNLCSFANELDGAPVGGRDPRTLRKLQEIVHEEYRTYCGL
jgi:D-alanine transaminase